MFPLCSHRFLSRSSAFLSPIPWLVCVIDRQRASERDAEVTRRIYRTVSPDRPVPFRQEHRHTVMHRRDRIVRIGHHHRIAIAPFVAGSPDSGCNKQPVTFWFLVPKTTSLSSHLSHLRLRQTGSRGSGSGALRNCSAKRSCRACLCGYC